MEGDCPTSTCGATIALATRPGWSRDATFMRLERADGSDWRIAALTLRHNYDDGDRGLVDVATKRAAQGKDRAS